MNCINEVSQIRGNLVKMSKGTSMSSHEQYGYQLHARMDFSGIQTANKKQTKNMVHILGNNYIVKK